jgi:hypothetical protein
MNAEIMKMVILFLSVVLLINWNNGLSFRYHFRQNEWELHHEGWQDDSSECYLLYNNLGIMKLPPSFEKMVN